MSDADLRIDPLTGAHVVVTPWRQKRPNRPYGRCPFCPGGLEAPEPYDVRHFPNRWPALPGGCHEVILHSPDHIASFPVLGEEQAARVVELWSARTAALGSRDDVKYVFVFENCGRMIGATVDHPHSQIMAFTMLPPVVAAELSAAKCDLCQGVDDDLVVIRRSGWQAAVPWAPSWPYEMLLSPRSHVPDLPAAGPELRAGLGAVLVERPQAGRHLVRARAGQPHGRPGLQRGVRAAVRPRRRGLRRGFWPLRRADRVGFPAGGR